MVFLAMLVGMAALLSIPPACNHVLIRKPRANAAVSMGLALVVMGSMHVTRTGEVLALMPSWLGAHEILVHASGAFQILLGFAFVLETSRGAAGWIAAVWFVAVLPIHVDNALGTATMPHPLPEGRWFFWLRVAMQPVYVAWALWSSRPISHEAPAAGSIAPSTSRTPRPRAR